ncbi:MAG: 2-iminoacetate synthase ThiH [Proteobacteria bacterium]|nr:2-iminoacetate synthase ThiH [Pseudomonadota bacterium]
MSFYSIVEHYQEFDFSQFFAGVSDNAVLRSLAKDTLSATDFLTLLSPKAGAHLEAMAQKAHRLTVQYFGRTIQLFIPLYISNYCANHCAYCGFNRQNSIVRRTLSIAEIEEEARAIAATGMRHVLFLTGESPQHTPIEYLVAASECLKRYFASVSMEIFPLDAVDYRRLQRAGVDGMTLFQETYDQEVYPRVHLAGRKTDYRCRLDAPARGAAAGFRQINIGALLGLGEPSRDIFFTGLHGRYLEDNYLDTEISISLPRFNDAEGNFQPNYLVNDRSFVQFMTALRLFLPRAGMTISTRESAGFRDRLMYLGATRYSAGSCTGVGGYVEGKVAGSRQFEITDNRSVAEVTSAIVAGGYQPVFKDWDAIA